VADIRSLFTDHFSEEELATLAGLLGRLPGGDVEAEGKPAAIGSRGISWSSRR